MEGQVGCKSPQRGAAHLVPPISWNTMLIAGTNSASASAAVEPLAAPSHLAASLTATADGQRQQEVLATWKVVRAS